VTALAFNGDVSGGVHDEVIPEEPPAAGVADGRFHFRLQLSVAASLDWCLGVAFGVDLPLAPSRAVQALRVTCGEQGLTHGAGQSPCFPITYRVVSLLAYRDVDADGGSSAGAGTVTVPLAAEVSSEPPATHVADHGVLMAPGPTVGVRHLAQTSEAIVVKIRHGLVRRWD
jgi:hypothetical protein